MSVISRKAFLQRGFRRHIRKSLLRGWELFCLSCDHFMSRVFSSDCLVYDHGSSHGKHCGS